MTTCPSMRNGFSCKFFSHWNWICTAFFSLFPSKLSNWYSPRCKQRQIRKEEKLDQFFFCREMKTLVLNPVWQTKWIFECFFLLNQQHRQERKNEVFFPDERQNPNYLSRIAALSNRNTFFYERNRQHFLCACFGCWCVHICSFRKLKIW